MRRYSLFKYVCTNTSNLYGNVLSRNFWKKSKPSSLSVFKHKALRESLIKPVKMVRATKVGYWNKNLKLDLEQGELISAEIFEPHYLGWIAKINDGVGVGIIPRYEATRWRRAQGGNVRIRPGILVDAYVGRLHDDGRLDLLLRPLLVDRISETKDKILEVLHDHCKGVLPVGDKSSAEEINEYIGGISKGDFKKAVGSLYREGLVKVEPRSVKLIDPEDTSSSPSTSVTLFLGNIHRSVTSDEITDFVQKILDSEECAQLLSSVKKLKVSSARMLMQSPTKSEEKESVEEVDDNSIDDITSRQSPTKNMKNLGFGFVDITTADRSNVKDDDDDRSTTELDLSADMMMSISEKLLRGKVLRGKRIAVGPANPKHSNPNSTS